LTRRSLAQAAERQKSPDDSFGPLMRQFFQNSRVAAEQALKPLNFTLSQFGALAALERTPGATSAELARRFMITPQASGELLAGMEKAGLLKRERHSENARMQAITPTEDGRKALAACKEAMKELEQRMLRLMTPSDRKNFLRLISLAIDGLTQIR
jgi:DNA-binding MarR family transcriptional regulator